MARVFIVRRQFHYELIELRIGCNRTDFRCRAFTNVTKCWLCRDRWADLQRYSNLSVHYILPGERKPIRPLIAPICLPCTVEVARMLPRSVVSRPFYQFTDEWMKNEEASAGEPGFGISRTTKGDRYR